MVYQVQDRSAEEILGVLQLGFHFFGETDRIASDGGREFDNAKIREEMKALDVVWHLKKLGHPKRSCDIEMRHSNLSDYLRAYQVEKGLQPDVAMWKALAAYNHSAYHSGGEAISDILLGVFCMPFTLIGQVLMNFIFGPIMCKLISYFQAVSVSVAVWTLVAISLERYFAICRPLKSRRWQTQFHAYKMIGLVWASSLIWNMPILYVTRLKAMRERGRHKCREEWPNPSTRLFYNLFLDMVLLLVPLIIMSLAYSLIVSKLWKGLQREIKHNSSFKCRII